MANSLKTMWSAFAVSLVAVASANAAFYDDNCCPTDCPCPPSRPFLDPCGNWYFNAEGLYWEASQDGMAFATEKSFDQCDYDCFASRSTDCSDYFRPGFTEEGKVKDIGDSWDGGFRVGIGYDLPCDGWDIVANWTWFRTTASKSVGDDCEESEFGSFVIPAWGSLPIANSTSAKWSLNLNILDIELGREFCVSPCLSLRPFIGFRAAWIDQKYRIHSSLDAEQSFDIFDTNLELSLNQDVDQYTRMKSKFSGFGVRGGFNSEWKLGCGFSLYGDLAGSILWGSFDRHTKQRTDINEISADLDPGPSFSFGGFSECENQRDNNSHGGCRAITDAAIGLRWKQFFDCDRIALTLSVGWEHHCFFDQNRFERVVNIFDRQPQVERGDLYTQGLTFAARLDF